MCLATQENYKKSSIFGLYGDVKAVVKQWFQQQCGEFPVEGIYRLVHK
jgi:hypothetical protein